MSYGSVYINSDIQRLRKEGMAKGMIVTALANKLRSRYPNMSRSQAKNIIRKLYDGKETTVQDWTW